MAKMRAAGSPVPTKPAYKLYDCPRAAGGEPAYLVYAGGHDDTYAMYLQAVGKNPEKATRSNVMTDANDGPMYAS